MEGFARPGSPTPPRKMNNSTIEEEDENKADEPWDAAKTEESSLSLRKSSFWPICQITFKAIVSRYLVLLPYLEQNFLG